MWRAGHMCVGGSTYQGATPVVMFGGDGAG